MSSALETRLLQRLVDHPRSTQRMWLRTLEKSGAHTVAELHALLDHPEVERRATAAYLLGGVGDRRWSARRLIQVLERPEDSGVRTTAAFALSQLDSPGVRKELVRLLQESSNEDVRNRAMFALGFMRGGLREIRALAAVLGNPSEDVELRLQAANALGGSGGWLWFDFRLRRAAMPVLLRALRDEDADIRASAAFNLGNIVRKSEIPALERLTSDKTPVRERFDARTVGQVAAFAIARIERNRSSRK